jgi:hypothetical protein
MLIDTPSLSLSSILMVRTWFVALNFLLILRFIGEEEVEPEVDLSSFLERQRLSESSPGPSSAPPPSDEGEVDESLAHISSRSHGSSQSKKGKVQTIAWDEELDEMIKEKAAAEATWGTFHVFLWNQFLNLRMVSIGW